MAVAIWDRRPSADELLATRLGRGWRPTASDTRDGPTVLGHAACSVMPRNRRSTTERDG
jgi:hypothetical protein